MANDLPQARQNRHFRLRRARFDEHTAVRQFAMTFQDAGVPPRPLHELLELANRRDVELDIEGVFVVEDIGNASNIIGAAACVWHSDGYIEICGATILSQGYGLQRVLTAVRTYDVDTRTSDLQFFCIVPRDRPPLRARMLDLGFEPWNAPDAALVQALGGFPDEYLLLGAEALKSHAKLVLDLNQSRRLSHRVNGQEAILELDLQALTCPYSLSAQQIDTA